jgi:hypothetical protein
MASEPIANPNVIPANTVLIAPSWTDPITGATYVHEDLQQRIAPWDNQAHISPMAAKEQFGSVQGFSQYVARYGADGSSVLVTWNSKGFKAILDYAQGPNTPGRCRWTAEHYFTGSDQWAMWQRLCDGNAKPQRQALEFLEDLAVDIVDPDAMTLTNLLRVLRATVLSQADTELRTDGTSALTFQKDTTVRGKSADAEVVIPNVFFISIPVLKGHTNDQGVPVVYRIGIRVRITVDDNAHLYFRFAIINGDRVLEDAFHDQVTRAATLLGDAFPLLRAAG